MRVGKPHGTRTGFTTGACAAAAARAATVGLVQGSVPERVTCRLPNGRDVPFTLIERSCADGAARAVVIKDAGDDPDCTDGARVIAEVRLLPDVPGEVRIGGGSGVGTVTMPGLGLAVGGPAINPVPRRNIEENVRAAGASVLACAGLEVMISVPGGAELAKKTINARLGILGGISILGTTGIVLPYSTAAWRASVVQGISVAARQGQDTIVLTTGGRTEQFAMRALPELAPICFIRMGDFLRYALDTIVAEGIAHVVIGGMVGKLTKMAQGKTITHAGRNEVDIELVAALAKQVGAPTDLCATIRAAKTARYAAEALAPLGLNTPFHRALAERVIDTLTARYPGRFTLRVLACDFDGNPITEARSDP